MKKAIIVWCAVTALVLTGCGQGPGGGTGNEYETGGGARSRTNRGGGGLFRTNAPSGSESSPGGATSTNTPP